MPLFFTLFLRNSSRALLIVFVLMLGGCGSRANETDAPTTPVAVKPNAPAFTTGLDTYIARDEPAYKWEKTSEKQIGKNLVTTLNVTSQTWQNIEWTHRVEIARPEKNEFPGWALFYLSTTDSVIESILAQSLATKMGAVTVHVMGIPNQPLFGKREDALMAHTFSQFIDGTDDTWPLLLPMTKGASKVMDAVQEYSAQQQKPLDKFIVTGASKRGWTTWLVGATDTKNRIGGIIPMVYDNFNMEKQLPHQKEAWGDYSPMIADYTRNSLQEKMRMPRGQKLTKNIDPYYYRSRLTMPKLIINATNDPYWTTDALNLYWNDLPEPKNVYYAPNVGHTMEGDLENVFGTSAAWFRWVASGKKIPFLNLVEASSGSGNAALLSVYAGKAIRSRIWLARAANRDFRKAKWTAMVMTKNHTGDPKQEAYTAGNLIGTSKEPFVAAFAESEFQNKNDSSTLRLSSPMMIWKAR